jgi:hypothetical protein
MSAYNLLREGDSPFFSFCKKRGIKLELIITDPETSVFDDFVEYKVFWGAGRGNKRTELKRTTEMLKKCVADSDFIRGFVSPIGHYYATMIMYKKSRAIKDDDDYMKIDLYNYLGAVKRDHDRRVIQLKRSDHREFFEFFEDEYARIKEKSFEINEYFRRNESSINT